MEFLHIATATIILFTIALILGKAKALSNYVLIMWLFLFLFNVVGFFLLDTEAFPFHGWKNVLLQLSDALVFLHGPLFLLYTMTLTRPDFSFRWFYLFNLLPFIIVLTLILNESYYSESPYVPLLETILKICSLVLYIIPIYLQLLKHRKNVKNIFSNAEQKYLGWLFILSNAILLLWIVLFVSTVVNIIGTMGHLSYDGWILKISTDVFLISICYFGVRQPALYDFEYQLPAKEQQENVLEEIDKTNANCGYESGVVKYQKSGLLPDKADEIHKKVLLLMQIAKPYINDNLTLFSLSEMIQIPPNHLSQVINLKEEKNFFDFVNGYRVEEVKKIIRSNQLNHYTLLGIAFECGFSSKAAFNRAFKKFTGLTPSEFKNSNH